MNRIRATMARVYEDGFRSRLANLGSAACNVHEFPDGDRVEAFEQAAMELARWDAEHLLANDNLVVGVDRLLYPLVKAAHVFAAVRNEESRIHLHRVADRLVSRLKRIRRRRK